MNIIPITMIIRMRPPAIGPIIQYGPSNRPVLFTGISVEVLAWVTVADDFGFFNWPGITIGSEKGLDANVGI